MNDRQGGGCQLPQGGTRAKKYPSFEERPWKGQSGRWVREINWRRPTFAQPIEVLSSVSNHLTGVFGMGTRVGDYSMPPEEKLQAGLPLCGHCSGGCWVSLSAESESCT
jgi:hypothetical protein